MMMTITPIAFIHAIAFCICTVFARPVIACDHNNLDLGINCSSKQTHFVLISATYNNKKHYQKPLDSVFSQTYPDWEMIYIDDASQDGTATAVEEYILAHNMQSKVTLMKNTEHHDKLENVYNAIHRVNPHHVIVMFDPDDWFENSTVLAYLNEVYQDPNIWITYGQCKAWPVDEGESHELPADVIKNNTIRSYPFATSHLKTFYAGLFQKVRRNDLMFNGSFITLIDDVAFMLPMLEMAGEHSRFISRLLYIVNVSSSQEHRATHLNDGRSQKMGLTEDYIRGQKLYDRIPSPF